MFQLPDLPFDRESFLPWTSAETFDFHHGKHHAGYVKKLNAAVEGTELENKSLEEVISAGRKGAFGVFNSAAQHFNHSFFWKCLFVDSTEPEGQLLEMINRDFGSLDTLKDQFSTLAGKHFGSGWVWLLLEDEKLILRDFHDADTPADTGSKPLLTLDVWEHAYYIDHRNDRASFIKGFWDHVNWKFVSDQLG